MKKKYLILLISIFLFVQFNCTSTETFEVIHQVTGGIETNCYLIYGTKSKEAALIDVGGSIDTLLFHIKQHELNLKYFLFTHVYCIL